MELTEAFPRVLLVTDEADDELTLRLNESHVAHPTVHTDEVVYLLQAQQL